MNKADSVKPTAAFYQHAAPHSNLTDAAFCIAWSGEGAGASIVQGWSAMLEAFAHSIWMDGVTAEDAEEWQAWIDAFCDPDEWYDDEGGEPFSFHSDVGEITKVSIYRLDATAIEKLLAAEAAPAALAPTPQQISDYLNGLDAIQREVAIREARAVVAPAALAGEPGHVYRDFRGEPAPAELQAVLRELDKPAAEPAGEWQERRTFEAWIAKDGGDLSTFGYGKNLHYRNSAVNNAWAGWAERGRRSASAPSAAQAVAWFINDAAEGQPPHYGQVAREYIGTPDTQPLFAMPPEPAIIEALVKMAEWSLKDRDVTTASGREAKARELAAGLAGGAE